jgi:hypothetical protein
MKIAAPHNFVRRQRFTWKRLVANKMAIATRSFSDFALVAWLVFGP